MRGGSSDGFSCGTTRMKKIMGVGGQIISVYGIVLKDC